MDNVIAKEQLIVSIEELKAGGLSLYKINKLVEQGDLRKLNKKFYENLNYCGEESDFFYAHAYVPAGVICLLSAASYYNLTSYRMEAVDVAIHRKARVSTLPEWPEIKLHHYTDERFDLGVKVEVEGKNTFHIYDIEKTVVDVVFYREKVGIEEMREILTNYLNRKDRNINKLVRYAEAMKCGDVMKKYLEVLV